MPAISGEIPLLPIPSVLFPGTYLPMQVSEESHRQLLRDCINDGLRVGVIFTHGDAEHASSSVPCTTGCLASVAMLARVDDDFDEEPINVVLYGERRIQVLDFVQQDPYLTARIKLLDDQCEHQQANRRMHQAVELFSRYLDLIRTNYHADVVDPSMPDDPTLASYLLASVLYLPQDVKQRWLESDSTTARLEEELSYLAAECEKHEALRVLSRTMHQRYMIPDPRLYLAVVSDN